mgnify:CR=1 FL=1
MSVKNRRTIGYGSARRRARGSGKGMRDDGTYGEDGTSDVPPGDPEALFGELHAQLHRLATAQMGGQPRGHTLQATALVNEVYLRLGRHAGFSSKGHFMASAARAMRSILVDHARGKGRQKRRAAGERVPLDGVLEAYEGDAIRILALDEALERLAARGEKGRQAAQLIELKFFCGLPMDDIAEVMGVSRRTADRIWELARATLKREL